MAGQNTAITGCKGHVKIPYQVTSSQMNDTEQQPHGEVCVSRFSTIYLRGPRAPRERLIIGIV